MGHWGRSLLRTSATRGVLRSLLCRKSRHLPWDYSLLTLYQRLGDSHHFGPVAVSFYTVAGSSASDNAHRRYAGRKLKL